MQACDVLMRENDHIHFRPPPQGGEKSVRREKLHLGRSDRGGFENQPAGKTQIAQGNETQALQNLFRKRDTAGG